METRNGHILTFSDKMQICAVSCFATCDWFCPMTSQMCMKGDLNAIKGAEIYQYIYIMLKDGL